MVLATCDPKNRRILQLKRGFSFQSYNDIIYSYTKSEASITEGFPESYYILIFTRENSIKYIGWHSVSHLTDY